MKSRVSESDLIVKRLKERIRELDRQIIKIQNSNDGRNKSLDIHDAKYEQFILKQILSGEETVRTDGDRELGQFY